jgi:hypothetical protein
LRKGITPCKIQAKTMKKGRFKPGESGNMKGRPKGATNKVNRTIKQKISDFLNTAFDELPTIWDKLKPRDRANLIRDLLPFVQAKMQSVNMDLDLHSLSEAEIDHIIETIINKQNGKND